MKKNDYFRIYVVSWSSCTIFVNSFHYGQILKQSATHSLLVFANKDPGWQMKDFLLLFIKILLLGNLLGSHQQPSRILEDFYCNGAERPFQGKAAFSLPSPVLYASWMSITIFKEAWPPLQIQDPEPTHLYQVRPYLSLGITFQDPMLLSPKRRLTLS